MKKPCRERRIFADFRCAAGLTGKNEKNRKKLLTIRECFGRIYKRSSELTKKYRYAALAQLVERRLGKAEVGGSNPLGSFLNLLIISGDFLSYTKNLSKHARNFPQLCYTDSAGHTAWHRNLD